PQPLRDRRAQVARRLHGGHAGLLHRGELALRGARAARGDRAGVAHALALGRGRAGDEADHRLGHVLGDVLGRLFLGGAADLADHDDALGLLVRLEQLQAVDEVEAVDRVAADPDHGGLAEARVGGLLHGLVGQRARARHDRDLARHVDVARHDPDLALARGDDARAVRPDQDHVLVAGQRVLDPQHVEHRDALGDRDDDLDAGVCGLEDRVGGVGRRHVDDRGVGAGLLDHVGDGVEHGQAEVLGAALARGHAADDPGAVLDHLLGVEGALGAGEALDDDLGVLVDQNAHGGVCSFAQAACLTAWTAFFAPSLMSSAGMIASPEFFSRALPASTLVPSRRTTTGTSTPTSFTAAMMPSAIMSQRTMPPKMLTKIAFTLSLDRISLNASVTRSLLAPPPTSRKLAGSPPSSLITSMVAIARPAPLTMQPMLPSMVT